MRNIEVADAWQIIFYRSFFFTVSILTIICFQNRNSVVKTIKNVGYPGIIGAVFYTFANIAFVHAFANTTVANSLFTLSAIPFITAILAFYFLDENISKRTISIMIVALLGIIIMISEGLALGQIYGNLMALVTAVSFSCFTIVLRKYRAVDMLPTILIGGIIILSVTFFISLGNLSIPLNEIFLCFLWGGVLSGCVNYIFIYATRHLYASSVTFFMLFEFALGPFWVWIFLNETITRNTFYGGILVMVSVFIYSVVEVVISRKKIQKGRINLH
jgi:drug/metabolite transporter (DMT)-like permease